MQLHVPKIYQTIWQASETVVVKPSKLTDRHYNLFVALEKRARRKMPRQINRDYFGEI